MDSSALTPQRAVAASLADGLERLVQHQEEVTAVGLIINSAEQWYALTVQTARHEVTQMVATGAEHIAPDDQARLDLRHDPAAHLVIDRSPMVEGSADVLVDAFRTLISSGRLDEIAPGAAWALAVDGELVSSADGPDTH